ncbi:MAG: DUF2148 domain-containing protein [Anaerolineaceae bacterium]|nr:DUF2148 domain-containing protein [Anaerolineaceae bacterium]
MIDAVETVAQMMAVAAVTAPKTKGQNYVQVKVLTGDSVQKLGQAMIDFNKKNPKKNFERDGKNVLNSQAVVLIGIKDGAACGLDCGACGFPDCATLTAQPKNKGEYQGPTCAFRMLDIGIALGSAAKVAGLLNVDNRIMYRAGVIARDMKLVDWDYVIAIPLSVSGKSIYFDR